MFRVHSVHFLIEKKTLQSEQSFPCMARSYGWSWDYVHPVRCSSYGVGLMPGRSRFQFLTLPWSFLSDLGVQSLTLSLTYTTRLLWDQKEGSSHLHHPELLWGTAVLKYEWLKMIHCLTWSITVAIFSPPPHAFPQNMYCRPLLRSLPHYLDPFSLASLIGLHLLRELLQEVEQESFYSPLPLSEHLDECQLRWPEWCSVVIWGGILFSPLSPLS